MPVTPDTFTLIDTSRPVWPVDTIVEDLNLVNSNNSVGTPQGKLSVSSMGAAVYELKIDAPNGGSLTPQVSLCYNSQAGGYGLAGYGFDITGVSVITRGGKDLFHDGQSKGVTYTDSDTYFLDGKRLIFQSGRAGQNGAVYSLEGDPFTKVTIHGTYSNSAANTWFEVKTNTGMTYQYGNSTTSILTYKNKKGYTRIASWYVSRATDRYCNYITYEYAISNCHVRPTCITYGTNSEKDRGIINKITFTYQSLGENARPFAIEDQQGKADVCISSITTTSNNSVYRKYTLSYNGSSDLSNGKWTRLVKVEEENGQGEKFPPVKFTWNYLPSPSVHSSQLDASTKDGRSYVEETSQQYMSADLNGDGVSDIIRVSPVKVTTAVGVGSVSYDYYTYVYVSGSQISSTGTISYKSPLVYTLPASMSLDDIKLMYGGASVMDFDGDGYNDLVLPSKDAATKLWDNAVFYLVSGNDVAAGRSGAVKAFAIGLQSTDKAPLFATFDVDGNGKDDVVCVEQRKKDNYYPCTIVQYANGTKLDHANVKLTLPQGVDKDIEKVFTGDYNNDGLSDLMLLYDGGYKIYFNRGGNATSSVIAESDTKSGTDFGNFWRMQQGDFDDDGLSDFVYNKQGESCLWIAHNNGDGTFTHTKAADIGISDHSSSKDDSRFSLLAYDIDHDGRTDVFVCKAGYKHHGFPKFNNEYTDTQVKWLCSTGTTLKLINSYTKNRGG